MDPRLQTDRRGGITITIRSTGSGTLDNYGRFEMDVQAFRKVLQS